jgi:hypothetical protein
VARLAALPTPRGGSTQLVAAGGAATPSGHQDLAPALAFRLRSCTQGAIKRVEAREADWAAKNLRLAMRAGSD